ncbi:MAG: RNA 2'-phosphotransferase [Vallitalea sp.]|jgi:putative RNA 2'-phosphotransferase|nr:RNA 2'-phosphotransferase [Vallitalea sp.]
MVNYKVLSKEISYALRHVPEEYGLTLDLEGWVAVEKLLSALQKNEKWKKLKISDIITMIQLSDKKRHEIKDDMIRALYGHSTKTKISKEVAEPPEFLYHGTAKKFMKSINNIGLIPKDRQYVHMSVNEYTAIDVGKRRDDEPVIIRIRAKEAYDDGILFYIGHDEIWLADSIPVMYIN